MSEIFFHDTHLHLDLYKDIEKVIKYIEDNKSYTIAVTNLPDLYQKEIKKYKKLKYIRFALGFHPELIGTYFKQIKIFDEEIASARYIGEIGLDKSKNTKNYIQQKEYFKYIIEKCQKYDNKIISIHSRNSVSDILTIIDNNFKSKIIMHWFSGDINELKECIERGYYFSINLKMMKSKKGKDCVVLIPANRILIESDEPLLTGSKTYQLHFVEQIMEEVSKLKDISPIELNEIMKNNFKELLK